HGIDSMSEPMLTVKQVSERLGVSSETIRGWCHTGQLKAVNVARKQGGRNSWRVSEKDLESFLMTRGNRKPESGRRRRSRFVNQIQYV
ncbi:MAG: helix-turn-helix domain-containing protein, partial [Planctomycetota bacterium]